jgi:POT family proton-dependent oligopeptide transporter
VSSQVDRQAGGLTVPVTWMYTFDGIATMIGIAVTIRFWRMLESTGREPGSLGKMAIGSTMTCAAFLILTVTSALSAGPVALAWLLAFFVLLDFSFIWGEPPLRAFVSRHAPKSHATVMMSLAIMSIAIANFTVGWLGRFYEPWGPTRFWLFHAGIAAAGVVAALSLRPLIARLADGTR